MPDILIIDDDAHINDIVSKALKAEGYAVSQAYSGTEALMLLSRSKPDLILLDLMLPGLSGEELLPQIKDIPVIVVSAKADVTNKVELLVGGIVFADESIHCFNHFFLVFGLFFGNLHSQLLFQIAEFCSTLFQVCFFGLLLAER